MAPVCRRLAAAGLGARRLEFACCRADWRIERIAIGTSLPSRDPLHLARLLAERIERIDPGPGIDAMILSAPEAAALSPGQLGLVAGPGPERPEALLIDRLANRLGAGNVFCLTPVESHVPERAMRRVPALAGGRPPGDWRAPLPRPVRLLSPPDPVEVVAPVPDDPPLMFRWRRTLHRVRRAEGPERIAGEWWRDAGGIRDYYRVEDESGRRYWLYRDGLYRPAPPPAWFLHGLFA